MSENIGNPFEDAWEGIQEFASTNAATPVAPFAPQTPPPSPDPTNEPVLQPVPAVSSQIAAIPDSTPESTPELNPAPVPEPVPTPEPEPEPVPNPTPANDPKPVPQQKAAVASSEATLDLGSEDSAPDLFASFDENGEDDEDDEGINPDVAGDSIATTAAEEAPVIVLDTKPKTAEPPQDEIDNPLEAAMIAQETGSIFSALPVFEYGAATEPIEDQNQTFDELRIAKAVDFPELEEEKNVTWTVTYGKIVKTVNNTDAKKKKVGEFKRTIESSKEFMDALKKAKDKNPRCVLKPSVRAQSKGKSLSAYKGIYADIDEAEQSGKVIYILPARDGHVYEVRRSEIGTFATRTENCIELSDLRAGFVPALPLVPWECLSEIISFFREQLRDDGSYEAVANILWDKQCELFATYIPQQIVTHGTVVADLSDMPSPERYLHYMDIHSHNTMPARFSSIDDADEKATRVYAVIGRLDNLMPEISVRISNGGKYLSIDPMLVFEQFDCSCPLGWSDRVTIRSKAEVHHREV